MNIESKLKVCDTYTASVLNYGPKVWGFHKGKDVELAHTQFCKLILRKFSSAPNFDINRTWSFAFNYFQKVKITEILDANSKNAKLYI